MADDFKRAINVWHVGGRKAAKRWHTSNARTAVKRAVAKEPMEPEVHPAEIPGPHDHCRCMWCCECGAKRDG